MRAGEDRELKFKLTLLRSEPRGLGRSFLLRQDFGGQVEGPSRGEGVEVRGEAEDARGGRRRGRVRMSEGGKVRRR